MKGIQGYSVQTLVVAREIGCYVRKHGTASVTRHIPKDDFHVHLPQDEEGFVWRKRGDKNHFACGRNGDHLVTPFQCDLCIFQVLKGHDPIHSSHKTSTLRSSFDDTRFLVEL